jgi:sensor histidine kinase YesM
MGSQPSNTGPSPTHCTPARQQTAGVGAAASGSVHRLRSPAGSKADAPCGVIVPLDVELDFLRLYLEIERIRYSDRLTVSFGIEPATVDALVPTLILQPLVENAVRHGIAKKPGPGRIEIRAARAGDELVLRVIDTGSGFAALPLNGARGVGLSNTIARIEELYGTRARLELANGEDGGAVVTVVLPFHEATQPEGAMQ